MIYCVDAFHEEEPDCAALAAAGVALLSGKISDGAHARYHDWAARTMAAAHAAGLLFQAYHYFEPDGNAADQFNNFWGALGDVGGMDGLLVPALDVEGDNNNECPHLSGVDYERSALKWLALLEEKTGRKGIVYTYPSLINEHLNGAQLLAPYPLWLSSVGKQHPPGKPASVTGWGGNWLFHQYSTTGGNGIALADQSVFRGTMDDLRALLVGATPAVALAPHDPPLLIGPAGPPELCAGRMIDGSLWVPARAAIEGLGFSLAWREDQGKAYVRPQQGA